MKRTILILCSILLMTCNPHRVAANGSMSDNDEKVIHISTDDEWGRWLNETPNKAEFIIIDEGVTTIPPYAFAWFGWIKKIQLPSSLQSIGKGSFCECNNLKSIQIPQNVSRIEEGAFMMLGTSCVVSIDERNPYYVMEKGILYSKDHYTALYCSPNIKELVFDLQVKRIADYAVYSHSTKTIWLPEGLLSIGEYAFICEARLGDNKLPKSLVSLGGGALTMIQNTELTVSSYIQYNTSRDIPEDFFPYSLKRLIVSGNGFTPEKEMFCSNINATVQLVFLNDAPILNESNREAFDTINQTNSIFIYFLSDYESSWSPHGEKVFAGIPIIMINTIDEVPK